MPRLLSSYAANKRVEDGLKRKQEQIRQDYVRATHRYLDETEKLVDDLIQINVRTPSAFQASYHSSATNQRRAVTNSLPFTPQLNTPGINIHGPPHHGSAEQLALLRNRSRSCLASDATTDDGASITRKEIPLPIVQVRGKDVFYQYENPKSKWKKVEPTYRTKVLLHRNDTVANALKQYTIQRNQESQMNNENKLNRKNSVVSRRDSELSRRSSLYSRRGSRRESRFSLLDDEEDDHIPPIIELKPQLSPGHTPRMLDGWTIMNWCLWNKQQTKPVWATKRYIERKNRELKRFQAARTANRSDLPAKPSSANPSAREARRKESMVEQSPQTFRAKSVPVHRLSMTIEEEDDEEEEREHFPERDRNLLRPTTSILRLPREDDVAAAVEENRPKTTQAHRRVALDTFTDREHNTELTPVDQKIEKQYSFSSEVQYDKRIHTSNSRIMDGKSVTICEPQYPEADFELMNLNDEHQDSVSINDKDRFRPKDRLAATEITVTGDTTSHKIPTLMPVVPLLKPVQKLNYSSIQAKPVFPRVQTVFPELGSDSPH